MKTTAVVKSLIILIINEDLNHVIYVIAQIFFY